MINLDVERLKRLPVKAGETWQGAVVRLPSWIREAGGPPYRPHVCMWMSATAHLMGPPDIGPAEQMDPARCLAALTRFATDRTIGGHCPGRIAVRDAALAEYLRQALAGLPVEVALVDALPALDEAAAGLAQHVAQPHGIPPALSGAHVTVERLRAFAEAAEVFYKAAPWRHLSNDDLIQVEAPPVERAFRHALVLGAGRQVYGLGFYASPRLHRQMSVEFDPNLLETVSLWAVHFYREWELPIEDADLWEDHHLPVAKEDAYPAMYRHLPHGRRSRPKAKILSFAEGLLRAIAETTEPEMDAGRWSKTVPTFDGPVTYQLALPDLLEPPKTAGKLLDTQGFPDRRLMERTWRDLDRLMEGHQFESMEEMNQFLDKHVQGKPIPHFEPRTQQERAQDLAYQAVEARGRRRIQLARQALEIDPDCADAHILLAERAVTPEEKRDLYAKAIAAAERTLGAECFEENAGHFWGITQTRPYMRARFGLAQVLEELSELDAAVQHYQELLRLNPGDNQGVRDILAPLLLRMNRHDDLARLMKQFKDDCGAMLQYARALLAFRLEGNSEESRRALRSALEANTYVPRYLLGRSELPAGLPDGYSLGGDDEAVFCVDLLGDVWAETPGALDWLKAQTGSRRRKPPRPRRQT